MIFVFLFVLSINTWAKNSFLESLNQKVEVKKKTRWTLNDWLDTKKQMSLMDSWLAANTSDHLFEFYLGVLHFNYTQDLTGQLKTELSTLSYTFTGFVSIFGLNFKSENEDDSSHLQGEILLRLLGKAEQSTRLNIFYGIENVDSNTFTETYNIPFYGASIKLYVFSFFALQAKYLTSQKTKLPNLVDVDGKTLEYGASVDVGPFQLLGDWVQKEMNYSSSVRSKKEGLRLGLLIYF